MQGDSPHITPEVCRTCLGEISEGCAFFSLAAVGSEIQQPTSIRDKLLYFLPEIDLDITPDAIICSDCATVVDSAHKFKTRCLRIEENIHRCPAVASNGTTAVNLENLAQLEELDSTDARFNNFEVEDNIREESEAQLDDPLTDECVGNINEQEVGQSSSEVKPVEGKQQKGFRLEIVDIRSVLFNTDIANFVVNRETGDHENSNNGDSEEEGARSGSDGLGCETEKSNSNAKDSGNADNNDISLKKVTFNKAAEDKPRFTCYECGHITTRKSLLISHLRSHPTKGKPGNNEFKEMFYKCEECGYTTTVKEHLTSHKKTHLGIKPFKCDVCDYKTVHNFTLTRHKKIHGRNAKPHKCTKCKYAAHKKSSLKVHLVTHTEERPFKCGHEGCDYSAKTKYILSRHEQIHSTDKPFKCNKCNYSAARKDAFNYHMMVHDNKKPFKCNICDYSTRSRATLNYHIKMHAGNKSYKCDLCTYSTVTKGLLDRHKRSHTDEKPYKCSECTYSSARNSHLRAHMYIHFVDRPYKCTVCDYRASRRSNLNVHLKIHTGEKPYKCLECDYRSAWPASIKAHMKINHSTKHIATTNNSSLSKQRKIHEKKE